ncbi:MAG: hypothetical protein WCS65_17025 [Verrucomicrobiae bacterium]
MKTPSRSLIASALCLAAALPVAQAQNATFKPPTGWPDYLAMGSVTSTCTTDDFSNKPSLDCIFTYDGDGAGSVGKIEYPTKPDALCNLVPQIASLARKSDSKIIPVLVCYQSNLSTGTTGPADLEDQPTLTMHLINLILSCEVLQNHAKSDGISPNIILNPDFLGSEWVPAPPIPYAGAAAAKVQVNKALLAAVTFATSPFGGAKSPVEWFNANPGGSKNWATLVPSMTSLPLTGTQSAFTPPFTSSSSVTVPQDFTDDVSGWIQAQNWIVRTFAPDARFGWHMNSSAPNGGSWVHPGRWCYSSPEDMAKQYTAFLDSLNVFRNASSAKEFIKPDYIVFDKASYDEFDSHGWPGNAWYSYNYGGVYNCDDWNTLLGMIGNLSAAYGLPVMLWQIPGGHLVTTSESPALTTDGSPDATYLLGDANVSIAGDTSNLASFIVNPAADGSSTPNPGPDGKVFPPMDAGNNYYFGATPPADITTIPAYLSSGTDKNWQTGHLDKAISSGVFAILWGAGQIVSLADANTTVIDPGHWLQNHIPTPDKQPPLTGGPWAP